MRAFGGIVIVSIISLQAFCGITFESIVWSLKDKSSSLETFDYGKLILMDC